MKTLDIGRNISLNFCAQIPHALFGYWYVFVLDLHEQNNFIDV
jgi:hypothetical protein